MSAQLHESRMRAPPRLRLPSVAQAAYLRRGLDQPGGKLPLFDALGRRTARKTVESCIRSGWCERLFANPMKPDWLVCRLTAEGRRALDRLPAGGDAPA